MSVQINLCNVKQIFYHSTNLFPRDYGGSQQETHQALCQTQYSNI